MKVIRLFLSNEFLKGGTLLQRKNFNSKLCIVQRTTLFKLLVTSRNTEIDIYLGNRQLKPETYNYVTAKYLLAITKDQKK